MKTKYYPLFGKLSNLSICLCIILSMISCEKYLDAKPEKALVIPSTLNDLQAILDLSSRMNEGPSYGMASADNYYLMDEDYNTLSDDVKKAYVWENFFYTNYPNDWARVYDVIYPANIVLEGIEKISPTAQTQLAWNNIKGSALVFRASSLLQGSFIFCKAYDEATSGKDLGLVLRLNSDFNAVSKRSSVKETYNRIIMDLMEAVPLLPSTPIHVMRPSKPAAFALLARTYLSMGNYDSCKKYSDLCLQIKDDLFDFNTMTDINSAFSFPQFNSEVIMATLITQMIYSSISSSFSQIDSTLYNSYSDNDLRKNAFFETATVGQYYKGSYSGTPWDLFTGIATDEVYLMRAECLAREGNKVAALEDLNKLIKTKWEVGSFIPFTANSSSEALEIILKERRKELVFRNLRWMDIKRLNKEGANIELKRYVGGKVYTLPSNDDRYALPLPLDIINRTGMQQNPK